MNGSPAEAVVAIIAGAGGRRIDPPTLLPARLVTELSGEAVRARLCAFTDESGAEWCLRPDMTTPIADLVARGAEASARFHYSGPVYRLPMAGSRDSIEFQQAGFEWFGGGGSGEDADALALILDATHRGAALGLQLRIGDVGLYLDLLEALPFTPRWRERLKRAFRRRGGVHQALAADARDVAGRGSALAEGLAALPADLAQRMVEDIFAISGVRPVGGRTAGEIAERLRERLEDGPPDPAAAAALKQYLAIEAPVAEAPKAIARVVKLAGLKANAIGIERLTARLDRLRTLAPPLWSTATFHAESGRRFDYYDGAVFDIIRPDAPDLPVAAGGRYDGLIARLSGGARQIAAIGASIRLDRLSIGRESAR